MRISDWSSDVCSSDLTYELLFNFPDKRVGWLPAARQRALHLFEEWRPDAILATAPPFTALLIGYLLAKRARIPLIVEFRDRWSDEARKSVWSGKSVSVRFAPRVRRSLKQKTSN